MWKRLQGGLKRYGNCGDVGCGEGEREEWIEVMVSV